ncbi:hypothetical protein C366_06495 [Cryptococcus neoformans Tu401-1]|nr:hypothetical protein C366_06495 [Cryptococcus neoformans var. grubii Tu401-1]
MLSVQEGNTNDDARKALGIRPGGQPPPQLKLDHTNFEDIPRSPALDYPPSPRSPTSSKLPSSPIPPSPTSPEPSRTFRRATRVGRHVLSTKKIQKISSSRGLYETQKLLLYLLDTLEQRETAPDILDRAAISAREISGRLKGKGKGKVLRLGHAIAAAASSSSSIGSSRTHHAMTPTTGVGSEDYEDHIVLDEGDWDTEASYNLVEQTRGLFVLAEKQQLDLFADTGDNDVPILDATPVKSKRRAGRFSSVSPSVAFTKGSSQAAPSSPDISFASTLSPSRTSTSTIPSIPGPYLLERTLNVLQSLLSVDCLHRTRTFRPLCPPNALQAACLDIAAYLYQKGEVGTKVRVVGMVIDGFYGMGEGMEERICEWLEGRMGDLLGRLARERGDFKKPKSDDVEWIDPFSKQDSNTFRNAALPTFAISSESSDSVLRKVSGTQGWMRFSPTSPSFSMFHHGILGLLSIQSLRDASSTAVEIAALVPRILMAITSTIDLTQSKLTTIYRVHRLLSLVLNAKPDSSLDLLTIIAHAPPLSRRTAAEILATFYPNAAGHNTVARRLPSSSYVAQRTKWETGQFGVLGEDETEEHHFVPWRVSSHDDPTAEVVRCEVCESEIHGFGIKCTMCKGQRHLRCYDGSGKTRKGVYQYDVVTLSPTSTSSQLSHAKFCPSLPRLEEVLLSPPHGSECTHRKAGQHRLDLIHLFTLTLCDECHFPLWGVSKQGYTCQNGCQRFFHSHCLEKMEETGVGECRYGREVVVDEISEAGNNPFVITRDKLQSSFHQHYNGFLPSKDELKGKNFDEIGVIFGTIWIQYQLIKNGLSSGSLRVSNEDKKATSDPLGLKPILKTYEELLQSHEQAISTAAADFTHAATLEKPLGTGYLFSEKFLGYCTALIRAPTTSSSTLPREGEHLGDGFLTPQGLSPSLEGDKVDRCYETLPLGIIVQSLATDLSLSNKVAATAFLNHLSLVGFISIFDTASLTSQYLAKRREIKVSFTLPLLMDASPNTELLVLAIEALLDDLDLTMNEQGLRLLATRAWPSLLCAPYALERLGKACVSWVISEEDCLRDIIKKYASKHRRIAGVRPAAGAQKGSVDMYKQDRQRLRRMFVEPWLKALHDQDPALYVHIVYEQCKLVAANVAMEDLSGASEEQVASRMAGVAVSKMTSMGEAGMLFSTVMELLTAWLEDLGPLADHDVAYRALPRLLNHQPADSADIFGLSLSTAQAGPADLARVCRWMRVLSYSGVEIPWELLMSLVDLQAGSPAFTFDGIVGGASAEAKLDLVIAINSNRAVIEPQTFASACSRLAVGVFCDMGKHEKMEPLELELVKRTMLLILQAYGVPVDEVAETPLGVGMPSTGQPPTITKKRQSPIVNVRFPLNADMVVGAATLLERTSCPDEMVLDFLWLLSTKAGMVDDPVGFLHHTCSKLYEMIWPLIGLPIDRRSRARVLLKLLSVNSAPLERIIHAQLEFSPEARAQARERLLIFILELADTSVNYELSNWRAAMVGLVLLFFDVLLDPRDVTPDNIIILKTLQPTQLNAMSMCFEEHLVKSSDERRLVLLSRLSRLRMNVPQWAIISWTTIDELLAEEVASLTQFKRADQSQTDSGRVDSQNVAYSLIFLGLEMLAAGVPITWIAAQRFQQRVAAACALPWFNPPVFTAVVLPGLRSVLDSPIRIMISGETFESKVKKTVLVGSLFVPVVIDFAQELKKYDVAVQRILLDILMVTFFKQDVTRVELSTYSAVQKVADFVLTGECSENRLLALQILQIAVTKIERDKIIRAVPPAFNTVAKVLVKELEAEYGDPAVVEQSQLFLRNIVKGFGRSGLYLQLFRNESESYDLSSPHETSLAKALQILHNEQEREALPQASLFDNVFHDLLDVTKRPRQQVIHIIEAFARFATSFEGHLSEEAAQDFGTFVNRLSKLIAEWSFDFDPNPILQSCAKILDRTPSASLVPLLSQVSTILNHCMGHFAVKRATAIRLLESGETASRKAQTENQIRIVLFEMAGSAINGLPVTSEGLYTLLKYLTSDAFSRPAPDSRVSSEQIRVLSDASPGCVHILLNGHPALESNLMSAEVLVAVLNEAGTVLCQTEMVVPGAISRNVTQLTLDAASSQVNFFLYLLLSSLDLTMGRARSRLLSLYPLLSRATSLCLRAASDYMSLQDVEGHGTFLISLAFMVMRLALLAVRDGPVSNEDREKGAGDEDAVDILWTRIWPEWIRLFRLSFDPNCVNGALRTVTHSVFLDLLTFLGGIYSPILLRHTESLSVNLAMLVQYQETLGVAPSGKLQKATQIMEKVGTHSVGGVADRMGMMESLKADLLAMERMKILNK